MTTVSEELRVPGDEETLELVPLRRRLSDGLGLVRLCLLGAAAIAVAAPGITNQEQLNSLIAIGILGLFAMSLDLILGYGGLPTLGHAMFFGMGAYVAGVFGVRQTPEVLLTLPLAIVVGGVGGYLVARIALRTQLLQFLMITFAFSGVLLAALDRLKEYTGGSDGLSGIPTPTIAGVPLSNDTRIYYLVLVVLSVSWWLMHRLVASPFGRVVVGIRDNAIRVRSLGIDPTQRLAVLFAVGSGFAAAAGTLHVYFFKFISPSSAGFLMAADGLFMVIIGGPASLVGGLIGAAGIYLAREELTDLTESPNLYLGLIFIVFVLLVRGGVVGVVRRGVARIRLRRGAEGSP